MEINKHFEALENMYLAAPINSIYKPTISISEGFSEINMNVSEIYHHGAGAVHGSIYFKMLDDAAFFAASSYELKFFIVTTSFTTYLTKPVSKGKLKSTGKVVNKNKSQFIVESIVYDSEDREIGRGNGIFVRSKMLLTQANGYEA